jgi:hypothetical protein
MEIRVFTPQDDETFWALRLEALDTESRAQNR